MADEVLTVPELAKLLKISEKTAYKMVQEGDIPAFKARGQWRVQRRDLDTWMNAQKASISKPNSTKKAWRKGGR